MNVGEVAGLIAAMAAVALVAFSAVPLLKLGRVLEELRLAVRDVGHNTVPILQELKGTVTATNTELSKLSLVTEDVSKVSAHAMVVSETVGVAKPDPEIFRIAARVAGDTLEGAWMIGDAAESDIAGAVAAGLRSVWLRRGRAYPSDMVPPTRSADSFAEAVGIVIAHRED